jgi:hypothetical protein
MVGVVVLADVVLTSKGGVAASISQGVTPRP